MLNLMTQFPIGENLEFGGYRTLRVAGVLTFRCAGAGKSVF